MPVFSKEIADELDLHERAKADARQSLPRREDKEFGVENLIIARVRHMADSLLDEFRREARHVSERLQRYRKDLHNAKHTSPSQVDRVKLSRDALQRSELQLNETLVGYKEFKAENQLRRDAYPDDRAVQVMYIVVIMIVEGLLNSYFFAPAFEFGLVGGFFVAFFVSFVNVGFAFFGGVLGLRYILNHANVRKQLAAAVCLLITMSICFLTVALSAFFRGHVDELHSNPPQDEDYQAVNHLAAQAWTSSIESLRMLDIWDMVNSLNAFVLFFVGVLCALLGYWKGYSYDDPYPGYGP